MKSFTLAALFTLCTAFISHAMPAYLYPVNSAVNFRLTATGQENNYAVVSTKTKQSTTATNITTIYKSTVTNTPIGTDEMLMLLANSFQTNFPAGAKLYVNSVSFWVMDSTGKNLILDVSSVLSMHVKGPYLHSGTDTFVQTQDSAGSHNSGQDVEFANELVTIEYDDSNLNTTDGTETSFELNGLISIRSTRSLDSNKTQTTFVLTGQGSGAVRGKIMILKGSVSGKGSTAPIL